MWNDDQVSVARSMWADGHSASMIAERLGYAFTRNAILGKVHREGWARGNQPALGWTEERRRQAAALYRAGYSPERMAEKIGGGITPEAAVSMAKTMGAARERRRARSGDDCPTSPASLGAARVDGAPKQGRDRDAQKAVFTLPARRALSPGIATDHGKSSRSAAVGSKGAAAVRRMRLRGDPPPRPDNEPVTLLELRHDQCRWPLGDPRDFDTFRYCGAIKPEEEPSYCPHHARRAYQPAPAKSLKRLDPDAPARRANNLERISRFATGA